MSDLHDESHHDDSSIFIDDPGMAVVYAAVIVLAIFFAAWAFGW